jgi:hypothetical protein
VGAAVRLLVRHLQDRPIPLESRQRSEPDGWLVAGLAAGPVDERSGPFVISGGWWAREVRRDYYFVKTRRGDLRRPFPERFAARLKGRKVIARERVHFVVDDLGTADVPSHHIAHAQRVVRCGKLAGIVLEGTRGFDHACQRACKSRVGRIMSKDCGVLEIVVHHAATKGKLQRRRRDHTFDDERRMIHVRREVNRPSLAKRRGRRLESNVQIARAVPRQIKIASLRAPIRNEVRNALLMSSGGGQTGDGAEPSEMLSALMGSGHALA